MLLAISVLQRLSSKQDITMRLGDIQNTVYNNTYFDSNEKKILLCILSLRAKRGSLVEWCMGISVYGFLTIQILYELRSWWFHFTKKNLFPICCFNWWIFEKFSSGQFLLLSEVESYEVFQIPKIAKRLQLVILLNFCITDPPSPPQIHGDLRPGDKVKLT